MGAEGDAVLQTEMGPAHEEPSTRNLYPVTGKTNI